MGWRENGDKQRVDKDGAAADRPELSTQKWIGPKQPAGHFYLVCSSSWVSRDRGTRGNRRRRAEVGEVGSGRSSNHSQSATTSPSFLGTCKSFLVVILVATRSRL
jgi:hypothetical protein